MSEGRFAQARLEELESEARGARREDREGV